MTGGASHKKKKKRRARGAVEGQSQEGGRKGGRKKWTRAPVRRSVGIAGPGLHRERPRQVSSHTKRREKSDARGVWMGCLLRLLIIVNRHPQAPLHLPRGHLKPEALLPH